MIIGLTGGIGSGKSAAGSFFESHNVTVIDADQLAKDALDINTPGFNQHCRVLWPFNSRYFRSHR